MTGARRFSLSSPDWGQAHLTLDAIVAYVDDELSPVAHARAEAHLDCCGECRAEVVAQRQARAALRAAGGPHLPSSLLNSLRSIPVEAELPAMPPGLGVTGDGQFVLLRDVPQADPGAACSHPACPGAHAGLPPAGPGPGPAAPRRFSHRARFGAVSGLALGALAVGVLATPTDVPEPAPPTAAFGGSVLNGAALSNPALGDPALGDPTLNSSTLGSPALSLPARLTSPSSDVSTGTDPATPVNGTSAQPAAAPAVLDAQLRDRLNRIPAAFRPEP